MLKQKNKKEIVLEDDIHGINISAGNISAEKQEKFEIVFSWETVDFIKNPQTKLYLTAAVAGSMGMIIWGISTKSLTVIFTFIMIAAVSILVLNEDPQKIKVRIDENGIGLNKEHFNFKNFVSFKISQMHGLPVLSLNRQEKYLPAKIIYVEEEPVDDLRNFLEIYLPEEDV